MPRNYFKIIEVECKDTKNTRLLLKTEVTVYWSMSRLITEHVYTAGMSELVKEDCSALAFILGTGTYLSFPQSSRFDRKRTGSVTVISVIYLVGGKC